jgi:ABC-type transport system involved in multi-copper enzyme maturation permease subunit
VRLLRAELLKARRRQATWVLLLVMMAIMAAIYLIAGVGFQTAGIIEFPGAYGLISQFAFGLGGLLGLVYAAALVGADWNWGVVRNVVARGESRTNYLLAKAGALAIILGVALLVIFAFGIVMTYVTGLLFGVPVASPLRGRGLQDLADWLVLVYPVLLQRAAIGLAVAVVLRSQLAGAVVGVLLYLGEPIVRLTFTFLTFGGRGLEGIIGGEPVGPEWFQFLPITVGDYVVNAAPGAFNLQGSLEGFFLRPVPLDQGLLAVGIYLAVTVLIAIAALNRQEIA